MNRKKINIKIIVFFLTLFSLQSKHLCMDSSKLGFIQSAFSYYAAKALLSNNVDISVEQRAVYIELIKNGHNALSALKLLADIGISSANAVKNWNVQESQKNEQLQMQRRSEYAAQLKNLIDVVPSGPRKDNLIFMWEQLVQDTKRDIDINQNSSQKLFTNEKLQAYLVECHSATDQKNGDINYYIDTFGDNSTAYQKYRDDNYRKLNSLINAQKVVKDDLAFDLAHLKQLPDCDIQNAKLNFIQTQGNLKVLLDHVIDNLENSHEPLHDDIIKIKELQRQFALDGYKIIRQFDLEYDDRCLTNVRNASPRTGIINKAKYTWWNGPDVKKNIGYITLAGTAILIAVNVGGTVLVPFVWLFSKIKSAH